MADIETTSAQASDETTPTLPGIPAPAVAPVPVQAVTDETASQNRPDKNPMGTKLRRLGASVVAKFKFRKGRGRPKNCRECDGAGCAVCDFTGYEPGKGDEAANDIASVAPISPAAGLPVDSPMAPPVAAPLGDSLRAAGFRRAVASAVRGVVKILRGVITIRARAAGIDDKFTEKALDDGMPKPEEVENFTQSLDAVLKKHNCEPKSTEEINLVIDGLNMFSGIPILLATFTAEIERKRKEDARHERVRTAEPVQS